MSGMGVHRPVLNEPVRYECGALRLADEPKGYLEWHSWAERKSKTHEQKQCPDPKCRLWHLWVRKTKA